MYSWELPKVGKVLAIVAAVLSLGGLCPSCRENSAGNPVQSWGQKYQMGTPKERKDALRFLAANYMSIGLPREEVEKVMGVGIGGTESSSLYVYTAPDLTLWVQYDRTGQGCLVTHFELRPLNGPVGRRNK